MVVAFGDVNSDQLLDLFMLSADQRTVSTWSWNRIEYQWKEQIQSRIHTDKDFIVVNVVPGDYNYDGKLDLLLMGQENPGSWWGEDADETRMQVYLQESNATFCKYFLQLSF